MVILCIVIILAVLIAVVIYVDDKNFEKTLYSTSRDPGKAKGYCSFRKRTMYVIINAKTNEFVYGTDYNYSPPHQRTSDCEALLFDAFEAAAFSLLNRQCGREYKIAEIEMISVKRILEPPRSWDEYDKLRSATEEY